jgi:hypothetical protein
MNARQILIVIIAVTLILLVVLVSNFGSAIVSSLQERFAPKITQPTEVTLVSLHWEVSQEYVKCDSILGNGIDCSWSHDHDGETIKRDDTNIVLPDHCYETPVKVGLVCAKQASFSSELIFKDKQEISYHLEAPILSSIGKLRLGQRYLITPLSVGYELTPLVQ